MYSFETAIQGLHFRACNLQDIFPRTVWPKSQHFTRTSIPTYSTATLYTMSPATSGRHLSKFGKLPKCCIRRLLVDFSQQSTILMLSGWNSAHAFMLTQRGVFCKIKIGVGHSPRTILVICTRDGRVEQNSYPIPCNRTRLAALSVTPQ